MDGTGDTAYALDYSESMAFFNSTYNPTNPQSITATEFDIAQELLWTGSNEVLQKFKYRERDTNSLNRRSLFHNNFLVFGKLLNFF